MSTHCTVVLLTFNCVGIIGETVAQARKVSPSVYAVDSFSTDGTTDRLRELGVEVVQRPFRHYADQRNWAIAELEGRGGWQLHLDADEVLDDAAVAAIRAVIADEGARGSAAWMIRRVDYFMGRRLRFSGVNPWHLRLFRAGVGRCEDRLYDQHFVSPVKAGRLNGSMHDRNAGSLTDWTARHNRWSDLEAAEVGHGAGPTAAAPGRLQAGLAGDPRERTRALKGLYYRLPAGWRAVGYFGYRYLLRLGFLDGREGFYFAVLQALWFRVLVDAKLHEARPDPSGARQPAPR